MEALAFNHPSAGKQFVQGTIESGETPQNVSFVRKAGQSLHPGISSRVRSADLPDAWQHITEDDQGHTFTFFWRPLDQHWPAIFHEAFRFCSSTHAPITGAGASLLCLSGLLVLNSNPEFAVQMRVAHRLRLFSPGQRITNSSPPRRPAKSCPCSRLEMAAKDQGTLVTKAGRQ